MRYFYILTLLVLIWGYEMWSRLPIVLQVLVLGNAFVAFLLTARKLYRVGLRTVEATEAPEEESSHSSTNRECVDTKESGVVE